MLGLGPPSSDLESTHSFTNYLFRNGFIQNHTLQFKHLSSGLKQIEIGDFGHASARVKYHIEPVHEYLNTMRIDASDVMLGNYSFLPMVSVFNETAEKEWMRVNLILGGDPFMTFETPHREDLNDYISFMNMTHPEIKLRLTYSANKDQIVVMGTTAS